jgi:2-iminobutanoate/2-iminopropanoate deaminase
VKTNLGHAAALAVLTLCACASSTKSGRATYLPAQGALGPYSAAVSTDDLCFVSGKIGAKRDDFESEADSAIDALAAELARTGLALADVVSVNVYLTDMANYALLNAVYARRFTEPYPARACVAVSALPGGAHVEIQAIARRR